MTDETVVQPETGEGETQGEPESGRDALADTMRKERSERKRIEKEYKQAQAKLSELQAAAEKAAEGEALAKGETSKVIESRDAQISKLSEDLKSAQGTIESFQKADRQRRLLDAVASEANVTNRIRLEGALLVAAQRGLVDLHPEDPVEAVKATKKALQKIDPDLFDPSTVSADGPSPGAPHQKPRNKPRTEAERQAEWEAQTKGTPWAGQPKPW